MTNAQTEGDALPPLVDKVYACMEAEIREHDVLFKQNLGDAIDHEAHAERLAETEGVVDQALVDCESLKKKQLTQAGTKVIRALVPFARQLQQTIVLLRGLYEALGRKAAGGRYGIVAYWKDTCRYKQAEKERMKLGQTLNTAWQRYVASKIRGNA